MGNAAYIYLSISFIQMLKALMPLMVFAVGCVLGTEGFSWTYASNMMVVAAGVGVASLGEINFVVMGVAVSASLCNGHARK